jgi:hypothetical protein
MRKQLVHKYLEGLKSLYPEIAERIYDWQLHLDNEVEELTKERVLNDVKEIIPTTYAELKIPLKHGDLDLTHFLHSWYGIDTLNLDAWLYNTLKDEVGYDIHNMSGLEKLEYYTGGNKKMCYLLK